MWCNPERLWRGVALEMMISKREKKILKSLSGHRKAREIIEQVCEETGIPEKKLLSKKRTRHLVEARCLCMWMIRKQTKLSLPEIGELFNRDHTTVLHNLRRMA